MNHRRIPLQDAGRRIVLRVLPAAGLLGMVPGAWGQGAYPNRALRVIVPQPPGGGFDFVARALAERLSKSLGQTWWWKTNRARGLWSARMPLPKPIPMVIRCS